MNLRQIVRASKENIEVARWRAGKVPRADFPIAKSAYGLGNSFKWCVISFDALGTKCKVLVVVNEAKQKYQAVLGVMGPNDNLRILCSYEYHATEPGWHTHATHDDAETLNRGYMRGPWIKRVPGARAPHRTNKFTKFTIGNEADAIRFACARYRIWKKGSLL